MRYFCGWCGRSVEEGDADHTRWYPFDSQRCSAAYGLRAGHIRVEKGDKAQTGFRWGVTTGTRAPKEQARGTVIRCPRCRSDSAVYSEYGALRSLMCYSCGYAYDELPDGSLLHPKDEAAKNFVAVGDGPIRSDGNGLKALRTELHAGSSSRRTKRDVEDEDDQSKGDAA